MYLKPFPSFISIVFRYRIQFLKKDAMKMKDSMQYSIEVSTYTLTRPSFEDEG